MEYFDDRKAFIPVIEHGPFSTVKGRRLKGYEYAMGKFADLTSDLAEDESIKFVTHSMGAAFAEGMAAYLLMKNVSVSDIVHLNPYQASDIISVGKNNKNVNVIDYQNTNDWVINKIPFFSSPGDIVGAKIKIREKGLTTFGLIHRFPIDNGKRMWNHIKKLLRIQSEK